MCIYHIMMCIFFTLQKILAHKSYSALKENSHISIEVILKISKKEKKNFNKRNETKQNSM